MATSKGSIAATVTSFEALGDGGIQWGVVEIPLGGGGLGACRTENREHIWLPRPMVFPPPPGGAEEVALK